MAKFNVDEWVALANQWTEVCKEYERAQRERQRVFDKAKTWLNCSTVFGNMDAIPNMLAEAIGRAVIEERKKGGSK